MTRPTKQISLTIDFDLYIALKTQANHEGVSMARITTQALKLYLPKDKPNE